MIIYASGFTDRGRRTGERVLGAMQKKLETPAALSGPAREFLSDTLAVRWRSAEEPLSDFVREAFGYHLPVLFIGAAGIAVRAIAPFVKDKASDSPVLVMDERASCVIPILSGHLGGANDIAGIIASAAGAVPVITTATDVEQVFSPDVFARRNALAVRNREGIRTVSERALAGSRILIAIDPDITVSACSSKLPERIRVTSYRNTVPETLPGESEASLQDRICADDRKQHDVIISQKDPSPGFTGLWLSPKTMVIGIGCRRGKTFEELNAFILEQVGRMAPGSFPDEFMRTHVRAFSTIDMKADEEGLQILAQYWHVPLIFYTAQELISVQGSFSESEFVRSVTGVPNVCERAAVRAAGNAGRLMVRKISGSGITMAAAEGKPCVRTFQTEVLS